VKKLKQLFAVLGLMLGGNAYADYTLNLTEGVTELSRDVHDLHMTIMWICVVIGVLVYSVMVYSIIHHRKSKGVAPAQFHENTKLEIVWTIIPFLILLTMAVPATRVMLNIYDLDKTAEPVSMTIKVTGYQWKWRYEYLDDGIDFFSTLDAKSNEARQLGSDQNPATVDNYLLNVDHPLVIPVNKKIRFLFTGADVIHSWWVPAFGWKMDTIPGFVTDGWVKVEKPGVYRGQCTELCGRDHGFMPIVVIAKPEAEYNQWLAEQKGKGAAAKEEAKADAVKTFSKDELIAKGKEVYNANCASCHQANGEGIPGTFPAITNSPSANGPIGEHVKVVLKGKGQMMPAFESTLTPAEIAAVVTFQRNGLGNSKGDMVQPAEVSAKN
jgi:cytochrome c oxidase subunit 2